jgi:DNA-binding transcriptional ArsR family regulator
MSSGTRASGAGGAGGRTAHATDARLARMAKALGHPARIAILRVLAERACVCGEIVDTLPLAQSTVSQHLKVLKEAGWITGVIDGPRTCYALDREAIGALRSLLDPLLARWEGAADCATASSCR